MADLDRIGKYRVLGRIGEGGMGAVYRAHDPLLNRHVALKTIAPGVAADTEFRQRFRREAQAAAQLNHPNVVTTFDFGEEGGITYVAMELLEGRDLEELIATGSLASLGEKLAIVEQICDGVGFAHSKGVLHRDLKPGNIHVQPNGQVKVLDFGLAPQGSSDMTRTGMVRGTPDYLSPEQVRGAHLDARSDVFSLGAVLYEVLSLRRPFGDNPAHETLRRILSAEPEPLEKIAPETPAALVAVVRRAMEKDPARRFAHGAAMAEAVRRARATISPSLLPDSEVASASTWGRGDATVVMGEGGGATVSGSAALALAPLAETQLTDRPAPTVAGPTSQRLAAHREPLLAVLAGVALASLGLGAWMLTRKPPSPPAQTPLAQVDILTEALVTSQVELAREDLDNRSFETAVERAQKALVLSPQNAEAGEVLALARGRIEERDAAAEEARRALTRGDAEAATRALGRVMAVDPSHPVVAELSGALNARFHDRAEAARRDLAVARAQAEPARGAGAKPYEAARRLADEADALFTRGEFTAAAQRYTESKNALERALREAEAASRAAIATPAGTAAAALPGAHNANSSAVAVPPTVPAAPPPATQARESAPMPTSPPALTAPLPVAPAAAPVAGPGGEAAIRQVIADYGRAIESRDIALFRSLKPDLSAEEEKRLREAFKAVKSHRVGLTVASVEVDGANASVLVSRQDVVNGSAMKPRQQTFRLVRLGDGWRIESIGQ